MRLGNTADRIGVRTARSAIAVAAVLVVGGCAAMRPAPVYRDQSSVVEMRLPQVSRDDLLNELSIYHGVPYREGGDRISGIDCSGLVWKVFGSLGVELPRTVRDQFRCGMPIPRREIRTGDLVFFGPGDAPRHVGIAMSNRDMLHASSSRGVVLESIDGFARAMMPAGARRIVRLR
jgi:hypothetical protein